MKGIMHCSRTGLLMAAVAGLTVGCHTLSSTNEEETVPAETVANAEPAPGAACSTPGCKGCNKCAGKLKGVLGENMPGKRYDWEKLRPDNAWPEQYAREAARRVNTPFGMQAANGSAIEQTIWQHYFSTVENKEAELTTAGKSRLDYLARRRPYVTPVLELQTSFDRELDQKRAQSIVDYVREHTLYEYDWQVVLTDRGANGLFGNEAPKAISKMIGPGAGPPVYEQQQMGDYYGGGS